MKTKQIRVRILTAIGVAFVGLLICFIFCTQALLQKNIQRDAAVTMEEFHRLFQTELDEESELCRVLLDSIETKPELQNAWLAQDKDALFQSAAPILEEFRSLHRITHLYFIDTNSTCFLRVHQKDRGGDVIDRFTLAEAVRTGETASGLELGPLGTFTLRVVRPWWVDGQLVGYIELGGELRHIAQEVKEVLGVEIGRFIKKSHLIRSGWEEGEAMLGRTVDWDQFPTHVVVRSTVTNIPWSVYQGMMKYEGAEHVSNSRFETVVGGRDYICGFKCLVDAAGQAVGDVVVMSDITDAKVAARRSVYVATGTVVLVGAALFGFLFLFIGQIQSRLVGNEKYLRAEMEQRSMAENALVLETNRAEEYLDLVEVMMVAINPQGDVTMINRKGCEVLGYDESEILGKNWFDHFVSEGVARQLKAMSNESRRKGLDNFEFFDNPILTKEGEERLIAWHNAPVKNEKGEIVGHLSSGEDITERKRAAEELRSSEEQFRTFVEQSTSAIEIYRPDGTMRLVNDAWPKFWNLKKETVLNYNILSDPESEATGLAAAFREAQQGRAQNIPVIKYDPEKGGFADGRSRWISPRMYPVMSSAGEVANIVLTYDDVTDQKDLEEQFRQAQKMESIGQLVGGVAHDFNNLLQIINGYATIAREMLTPEHAATTSIEEIAKAGEHAKELVQQLLTYSRQQVIDPVDLDLNKEIKKSQKMLRHLIGEHIQFEFVAANEIGTVFADKGQIHQVLMNLCVNARDAMPEGGTLTVQTENIEISPDDLKTRSWARLGDYVLLSVRDTGCGMDKETCGRIFDPFFTTKEVGKGTGLGLSTVYGIVNQNEGHVDVTSEPGEGTTFEIYLPVSQPLSEKTVQSVSENIPSSEGGVETILVVEDADMILELATYTLKDAGYTVLTAKNGQEAVQVFEAHVDEIDCVIMDVVMPRMGGKEAMGKILKKRPSLRHLFVSGYSPDTGHTGFIKETGEHLLEKPYEAAALLQKIREVLDED